jgi:tetratricopeptide (TPR) repeat protein
MQSLILVQGVEAATVLADRLMRDATSEDQRATALARRALARLMAADHGSGVEAAREAIAIAERLELPWVRFEAGRLLAIGLSQREQPDEALAVLEPFQELVEREGSPEQRGNFLADYAYVLNSARKLRRTAEVLKQGIAHARTLDDTAEAATLTSNLALVQGNLGQPEAALESILQSRALQQRLGDTAGPTGAAIDMYVGMYEAQIGRYREALASLDAALAVFGRDPASSWNAVVRNHRALLLLDLGQIARARQALDYREPSIASVRARSAMLQGRIAVALGLPAQALFDQALTILGPTGDVFMRTLALLDAAGSLPPAERAAACAHVEELAGEVEYLGIVLKARLLRVRSLVDAGSGSEAAALLPAHEARFNGVKPADLYFGQTFLVAFQALSAAGAPVAARAALEAGVAWVREQALPNVPAEYRDSFLERNPANRALLTAATRTR